MMCCVCSPTVKIIAFQAIDQVQLSANAWSSSSLFTLGNSAWCMQFSLLCHWFLERSRRERWGSLPSWWILPITGNFGGDGGKLRALRFASLSHTRREKRRTRDGNNGSICKI
ncbi:hypothetical protein V6N13_092004 [Hibiscus sabdariffa]|uniref:Uncharacterized protein n=1 Tax=Hibiscus sabdariffa TaxID=183260 RepID=A0ABR2QFX1_9ROSI